MNTFDNDIEQIKVILKFSINKIFEMYYFSQMELSDIILLSEKTSHIKYNSKILERISKEGSIIFDKNWFKLNDLVVKFSKNSEKRKYYNDSLVAIIDLMNHIDNKYFKNKNCKLLFIILIVLTKLNEL